MGVEEANTDGAKRAVLKARKAVFPLVLATVRARWRTVLAVNILTPILVFVADVGWNASAVLLLSRSESESKS